MGALHAGHLSLVQRSRALADRTCVTLFVNPTQFGPNEDFEVYPRDEAADADLLMSEGTDLLFAPDRTEMYPEGDSTRVAVTGVSEDLEGAFRPHFFTGVATVVTKLLLQALPDVAVFGEKDYQQLQVIKRLVRDLHIPVHIESGETVREADGLALSSRNAYLSPAERAIAPALHQTLASVAAALADGADGAAVGDQERRAAAALENAGFRSVDYIAARDAETLGPWIDRTRPGRVLAAAWLGRTRLIDNVPV